METIWLFDPDDGMGVVWVEDDPQTNDAEEYIKIEKYREAETKIQSLQSELAKLREENGKLKKDFASLKSYENSLVDKIKKHERTEKKLREELEAETIKGITLASDVKSWKRLESEAQEVVSLALKELEDMREPMECGHFQANLQPSDEGVNACTACVQLQLEAEREVRKRLEAWVRSVPHKPKCIVHSPNADKDNWCDCGRWHILNPQEGGK